MTTPGDPDDTVRLRRAPVRGVPFRRGAALTVIGCAALAMASLAVWRGLPFGAPEVRPSAVPEAQNPPVPPAAGSAAVPGLGTAAAPGAAAPDAATNPVPGTAPSVSVAANAAPRLTATGGLSAPVPGGLSAPALSIEAPAETIVTAGEATILAHQADVLTVFRFGPEPRVLVLDFPGLAEQARMLNRVAAFTEKAGLPRDRVLSDEELAAAIRVTGSTPETWYYGHDYSAAELVRFFAAADRDGVRLNAEEERLRRLSRQEGWIATGAPSAQVQAVIPAASSGGATVGALLTLPRVGSDRLVDFSARSTILRHELSHGAYFTEPAYAAVAIRFWRESLSDEERAAFRRFLGADGYDTADEDLMRNEAQAYLMHTADPRFFSASAVGLRPDRLAALRTAFRAAMPAGWLRDATPAPPPVPAPPAPRPAHAPRRRGGGAPAGRAQRPRWAV